MSREADAPKPVRRRPTSRLSSPRRVARSIGPIRPRAGTLVTLALAAAAAALTWADPFAEPDDAVLLVNNRSGGRRVFPTLVDADPGRATIELQAPGRALVRIVPAPDGGHQLMRDDTLLGPLAAEDFDGLWSSLRLATATRKTGGGREDHGVGQHGVIRIILPDSNLTLSLGETTTGGGVYAVFEAEGEPWVVEAELLSLVQQPPKTWLSPRLVPVDPELVTSLTWGDELVLGRGTDGLWRIRSGAPPALLSSEAVDFRLRRLLRAQLDPFVEREAVASESLRPWLVVTTVDGGSRALLVGGECPGYPARRLVDRGPGLLGCAPASVFERWPLHDPDAAMIETRLAPYDYARLVAVELEQPAARRLVRRGGGEWFYQVGEAGEDGLEPVAEEEVRRWYQGLARLEVALAELEDAGEGQGQGHGGDAKPEQPAIGGAGEGDPRERPLPFEPDWIIELHADSDEPLRVSCRLAAEPALCVRDGGPVLRVLGEIPRNLAFEAETFADRRLTRINPGEIRALEILPPLAVEGSPTVRQSVHADMGVWELDAPVHVDDSGAVDQVRLENVLWALRQLRAEAWVQSPSGPPLRRLSAEVVPAQGLRRTVSVVLHEDCVVTVEGHRPAAIPRATCEALSEDIFFDDPLRFWLERSRGLEIARADTGGDGEQGEERVFLRRRDEQFVTDDGRAIDESLADRLRAWIDWRSAGVRAGQPPTPATWTLDVRREFGPPAVVELGEGWVRLRGADWYYVEREPAEELSPNPTPNPDPNPNPNPNPNQDERPGEADFDPGAIEVD